MNTTAVLKQALLILGMISILVLPSLLFVNIAQGNDDSSGGSPSMSERLENVAAGKGGSYKEADETTFSEILGYVVNAFLGLLGIIFVILILIGGTRYMTASGNEEKAKSALATIRHAIIGLIIVVGAYAIWTFIFQNFLFT